MSKNFKLSLLDRVLKPTDPNRPEHLAGWSVVPETSWSDSRPNVCLYAYRAAPLLSVDDEETFVEKYTKARQVCNLIGPVVATYMDVNPVSLTDRPAFRKMLQDAQQKGFTCIACGSLTELSAGSLDEIAPLLALEKVESTRIVFTHGLQEAWDILSGMSMYLTPQGRKLMENGEIADEYRELSLYVSRGKKKDR